MRRTICVSGYTETVRPSSSYTDAIKQRQLAAGYRLGRDTDTSDYEEDHLVPLELGGSPTSVRNLWPEPYRGTGARAKDTLENTLHGLVCDGALPLRTAQHAIAANWWRAYQRYVIAGYAPRPRLRPTPRPVVAPPESPRPRPRGRFIGATHSCTRTSSGSCIEGGEFCPQASYGHAGYDAQGRRYTCTGDRVHPHWEP